jgi:hypothetical protein
VQRVVSALFLFMVFYEDFAVLSVLAGKKEKDSIGVLFFGGGSRLHPRLHTSMQILVA